MIDYSDVDEQKHPAGAGDSAPLRRPLWTWILVGAALSAVFGIVYGASVRQAPNVHVRWVAGLDVAEREAIRSTYKLARPQHHDGETWAYDLLDTSGRNVRALVNDPRVADTHEIDRRAFRVDDDAPVGDSRTWIALQVPVLRTIHRLIWPIFPLAWLGSMVFLAVGWTTVRSADMRRWGAGKVSTQLAAWWTVLIVIGAGVGAVARAAWRRVRSGVTIVARRARAIATSLTRWGEPTKAELRAGTVAVVAGVWLVELLGLGMLSGDDHNLLWMASSLMRGDMPFRDFYDLGVPLNVLLSWLAQELVGYRMIGEVLLGILLMSIAFALSFRMAAQAAGSIGVALATCAVGSLLLLTGKLYSYPKIFAYPFVLWLCWRYLDRQSRGRLVALAAGVAVAFLLRHDHGAYLGPVAAMTVLAAHRQEGTRASTRAALQLVGICGLFVGPYIVWGMVAEGPRAYFQTRLGVMQVQGNFDPRPLPVLEIDRSAGFTLIEITPLPPTKVKIDWRSEVTEAQRRRLEQQYSLTDAQFDGRDGYWDYLLMDTRLETTRSVLAEPAIVDVRGIDATTGAVQNDTIGTRWRRTVPLLRLSILPALFHSANASRWLYALFQYLPLVVIVALLSDRWRGRRRQVLRHEAPKMSVTAVCLLLQNLGLLKLVGYAVDVVSTAVVPGAWLLARALTSPHADGAEESRGTAPRWRSMPAPRVLGVSLFVITALAAGVHGQVGSLHALNAGLRHAPERISIQIRELATSPPIDAFAPVGSTGDRALVRWIYECTRPEDRVWNLTNDWTLPYQTERGAVQHMHWSSSFRNTEAHQRKTLEWLAGQSVPIVLSIRANRPLEWLEDYPLLEEYAASNYVYVTSEKLEINQGYENSDGNRDATYILVERGRTPTGTYEQLDLPCFR